MAYLNNAVTLIAAATGDVPVGGTVPATLALTLGAPAQFGAVHAGRREDVPRVLDRHRDLDRG